MSTLFGKQSVSPSFIQDVCRLWNHLASLVQLSKASISLRSLAVKLDHASETLEVFEYFKIRLLDYIWRVRLNSLEMDCGRLYL